MTHSVFYHFLQESQQVLVKLEEEVTRLRQESSDWSTQMRDLQTELQKEREERKKETERTREEREREKERERDGRRAEVQKITDHYQNESKVIIVSYVALFCSLSSLLSVLQSTFLCQFIL